MTLRLTIKNLEECMYLKEALHNFKDETVKNHNAQIDEYLDDKKFQQATETKDNRNTQVAIYDSLLDRLQTIADKFVAS